MSLMRRARPITSVVGYNTSLLYRLIRLSLPKGEASENTAILSELMQKRTCDALD
jgi:hypothetical protein